ncbi:type III-B CRISPR module-associated protein Cmr5 [Deinococcus aquiradiocola]|uniref:CRISPR type III-B/RAMP module-associated protein Cmr5 n=1 Tax=Deinococcus aquiradiocola TaxID=393059 RepID=A0A917PI07_9DEIO|nr:type III-B CRISPR module-associated protein Cmr5 [Deinococcus aquiradiocola]GGJ78774.1 CRISPR system Cmr subunit Cmr5 [Deinococcus aquiradiocola]
MNRDQQRAQSAYRQVSALPNDKHKKYGVLALNLPFLIRSSGLAQALAFTDQKARAYDVPLLDHLAATVGEATGRPSLRREQLLAESRTDSDPASYLMLTREALLAATWFKRLASSILKVEPGEEVEG